MSDFLFDNAEDADFNQYWYSARTIERIVEELTKLGGRMAFLSTPSLYFSLPMDVRQQCKVFDYDKKWQNDEGFVFYDFNAPETVPQSLEGCFDVVIIDPPFIVEDVWRKYAITTKYLLKPGCDSNGEPLGKVIGTTICENEKLLKDILNLTPTAFQPSIPNLVYQYHLFTNYESEVFAKRNPEIPE